MIKEQPFSTLPPSTKTSAAIASAYEELPSEAAFPVHMAAGAAAGIAEHTLTFPLDLLKTRMQVLFSPHESTTTASPFKGKTSLRRIAREEGVKRVWRGVGTVIVGAGPAHALYFASYEACRDALGNNSGKSSSLSQSLAGALATTLADALMTPFDVVKQRMQVQGGRSGMVRTAGEILRREGPLAFYLSYPATLALNIPFHGIQFPVYEAVTSLLNPSASYSPGTHIIAGAIAGGLAAALTTPLDVIKTTLQTRGLQAREADRERLRHFKSTLQFIVERGGGFRAFFRGLQPRVLAAVPSTAICWTTYEYFKWVLLQ